MGQPPDKIQGYPENIADIQTDHYKSRGPGKYIKNKQHPGKKLYPGHGHGDKRYQYFRYELVFPEHRRKYRGIKYFVNAGKYEDHAHEQAEDKEQFSV